MQSTTIHGETGNLDPIALFVLALVINTGLVARGSSRGSAVCNEVVKKGGEILMTAKAYNNRCIQLWLSSALRVAAERYPLVERLAEMSVCMLPGCGWVDAALPAMFILPPCARDAPRTSLARFMHLAEAAPRFLPCVCN